ncbi:MAG: BlaI/MecI/CopY family transcriptional regulator [bacterium]|nr:BlaI/MecI/CopY family transcriptional regulator [bacterium]
MKVKQLSGLEEEVMNIIWGLNECSIHEIKSKLDKNKKLAYTTIATIAQRLNDKGMLRRKNKGKAINYSPKVTKEVYSKDIAKSFINKMQSSFGDVALASFAQSLENLSKDKREYLIKLLEENENH